jgi:CDP-diacylglycerol---serine O-phosphatidyltransferase
LLASASALRLARFNVAAEQPNRPVWASGFFTGIPAPGGAFLGLLPIYLANSGVVEATTAHTLAMFSVPLIASLMVSTVPTFSGKRLGRMATLRWLIPSALALMAFVALLVANAWLALTVLTAGYLLTLPLSTWRFETLRKRSAA